MFCHNPVDVDCDGINGSVFPYRHNTMGLPGCDRLVLLMNSLIEGIVFPFEAIFIGAVGEDMRVVAGAGATEGGRKVGQQQDGEVGLEVSADCLVKSEHTVASKLTASTLVCLRGIRKAVAKYNSAGSQCGKNDLSDGLSAVGKHEGEFSEWLDGTKRGFRTGVEKDFANTFAE